MPFVMKTYKADLHIHSVLSPCGDLDMSPRNIVEYAKAQNLQIIAVTDHNSTLHGPLVRKLAAPMGIAVLFGAEVTSREEVHCLCLFDTEDQRVDFQEYINVNLPDFANDPSKFGHQVVVNELDEIIEEIKPLLISALKVGVNDIEKKVHELGGLFIPAHVDRPVYSLISQLGFIPPDLNFDALEIFRTTNSNDFLAKHSYLKNPRLIKNSDSHYPHQIGSTFTVYQLNKPTCFELSLAFKGQQGRGIVE